MRNGQHTRIQIGLPDTSCSNICSARSVRRRGWSAPAFGSWDTGNTGPIKRVPAAGLQAEFWIEPIEDSLAEERFQFLHLSTDQVRFANNAGEPVALERIPAVLFSELMRDVDLFVSVASIGNDPGLGNPRRRRLQRLLVDGPPSAT